MDNWCNRHNRSMLPSKFGEGKFWCPDCSKEKKQQKGLQSGAGNPKDIIIIEKLDAINSRLDKLIQYIVNKLGKQE